MPRGSHGGGEHPWGQEHREGDPAGAAPAGKKGDEAGAVVGAGEPLREPPPLHAAAGTKGGWEQELAELPALAEPWDAACWSQGGRGKHARATGVCPQPCAGGVGSSLWNHPCDPVRDPASGTIPTQQARACRPRMGCRMQTSACRAGQGGNLGQEEERGSRGGELAQPRHCGCCRGHRVGAWGTQSLIESKRWQRGEAVPPAKKERPWGGRELCPQPRDRTGATSTDWTSCPHPQH